MPKPYQHTQIGFVILVSAALLLLFSLLFIIGPALQGARVEPVAIIIILLVVAVLLLFSTLTIAVGDGQVRARFGPVAPGFFGPMVALAQITSCTVVDNIPWYHGWGIRWTPSGWLYRVSGSRAVEVTRKDGSRVRFGSDEPEALCAAIRAHLGQG